jgi:hypothetical protein
MILFADFSRFFARLLSDSRLSARFALFPELAADLIEVRIPHPELDLNDFWAFGGTAD